MKTAIAEPERIARLPHDGRGYPIPWNVLRGTDGHPFFIVNDDRKVSGIAQGPMPDLRRAPGALEVVRGRAAVRLPPSWLLL